MNVKTTKTTHVPGWRSSGSKAFCGLRTAIMLGALPLGFAAHIGAAQAQSVEAPSGLEEIVVTARRREEKLQETPIAISAFTAAALERQQIFSTADLDRVTPNLQFTAYGPLTGNNSAAQVFIRGIGQTDASSGVDPGVGMYMDDVYMGRAVGGVMDFRDIANVQVLRGPQGTLFGRNTIGGAVLLTTTQPSDEFSGTARLGIGDDNLREAFGAVTLPITDGLAARVSAGGRKRDGYVMRIYDGLDLGDENSYTVQSSVRWHPDDAWTLTVRGDYTKANENGSPFVFATINGRQAFPAAVSVRAGCPGATFSPPAQPPFVPPGTIDARCANAATWNLGPYTNGGTAPARSDLKNWGVSATAQWVLNPALTFKSITAYRELSWLGERDADNTPFVILDTNYASSGHQFSEELQALVTADRLNGVFGAFFYQEGYIDFLQVNYAAPPGLVAVPNGAFPGSRDHQLSEVDNKNWAAFTQWTYKVTDPLSLTAGARYTHERKGARIDAFTITPLTLPDPATPPTGVHVPPNGNLYVYNTPFANTYTATTGSASVQYQWTDAFMTYVSWSQGFKSGGFNQRFNSSPGDSIPVAFDAEKAQTYEIGFKSELARDFRLNGALFRTKYRDMQLIYRLGIAPLLFNAGKATIQGGELEFTFAPNNWIVEGSVGYLSNSIDEVPGTLAVGGVVATGVVTTNSSLPFTPKWQSNLGVGYTFHLGSDAWELTPRVDATYTAKYFFDAANSVEVAQLNDVTVLTASLSLGNAVAHGKWRVTAAVDNLTDKLYRVAGNSSFATAAGYSEVVYARPRNYTLRATYDF